jgi:thiol-disulfide isomerase/thioredoxin
MSFRPHPLVSKTATRWTLTIAWALASASAVAAGPASGTRHVTSREAAAPQTAPNQPRPSDAPAGEKKPKSQEGPAKQGSEGEQPKNGADRERDQHSETKDASSAAPATPLGPMHGSLFTDLDGNPVSLAEHAGKPMVIEMWATWCGPCRKQRETIHKIAKEFPDVVFVGASVDEKGASAVKQYLATNAAERAAAQAAKQDGSTSIRDLMATPSFRALISKVRKDKTVPQTVYVSRRGEIADVALGQQDERFMRAVIKNLLKAKAPAPADGSESGKPESGKPESGKPAGEPTRSPTGSPTGTPTSTPTGTPTGTPAEKASAATIDPSAGLPAVPQ